MNKDNDTAYVLLQIIFGAGIGILMAQLLLMALEAIFG